MYLVPGYHVSFCHYPQLRTQPDTAEPTEALLRLRPSRRQERAGAATRVRKPEKSKPKEDKAGPSEKNRKSRLFFHPVLSAVFYF